MVENGWPKFAIFVRDIPEPRKRRPLANHIKVIAHLGG